MNQSMKVIIIEDEKLTADDLAEVLQEVHPETEIIKHISSVAEGLKYFNTNPKADLIFSDIQLGDGLSFEIFNKTNTSIPVIFCTAYDEYALNAFKANSIDYILKPFSNKNISESIEKYQRFRDVFTPDNSSWETLLENFTQPSKVNSVLVHYKAQIIPIPTIEIAFFYIKNEVTLLRTFKEKSYILNKPLDTYQVKVGDAFFRANRQYLVNRKAIRSVENYGARKLALLLNINHDETITVSKEKHTSLMSWLEGFS